MFSCLQWYVLPSKSLSMGVRFFHSSFHATEFKIKLRFSSDNNPHLFSKIRVAQALKYRPSTNGEHELLLKDALGWNFKVTRFTVLKTT